MNLVAPDLNAIGLQSLGAAYRFNLGGGEVRPGRLIRGALPTAGKVSCLGRRRIGGAMSLRGYSEHEDTRRASTSSTSSDGGLRARRAYPDLALVACEDIAPGPSAGDDSASAASPGADPTTTTTDLAAIACATDDPEDVGELTGAWSGSEGGVYYIRQVGDCVWWFGTEIEDIEPGLTGQRGFANVASGRVDGTRLEVEYADLPVGNVLGGGGLTFAYDEENGTLTLTEQRGDWIPFGGSVLTRIERNASPDASPSAASSP